MQESHFKIQYGDSTAELAIGGDISLYAFAEFIIKAVGFSFDHAFQFCDNLKNPYRSEERYTLSLRIAGCDFTTRDIERWIRA